MRKISTKRVYRLHKDAYYDDSLGLYVVAIEDKELKELANDINSIGNKAHTYAGDREYLPGIGESFYTTYYHGYVKEN